MNQLKNKILGATRFEYKITALYFIVGMLWIFFSDTFFGALIENKKLLTELSIAKGFAYVIITSLLLFYFVRSHTSKLRLADQQINERREELEKQNHEYRRLNEELKRAKEKAEESDRLKTAFLQNISHEIRTPLNSICGFTSMLNKPDLSEEKRMNFTSTIQSSSNQLLSIVSDILTISSLETRQEKLYINKFSINGIVDDLFSIYKPQADKKNILLLAKKEQHENPIEIYADRTKITQVLNHLLSNAIKFTNEGFIEFGYHLANDEIVFHVKDSGIGIEEELQEIIFERFRQSDLSINKSYGGTGLGLSISKGLAELLGGEIYVTSLLGNGSTFYFSIPYTPANIIEGNPTALQQEQKSL